MRGQKYKRGVQLTTELYNLIGHEKKKKESVIVYVRGRVCILKKFNSHQRIDEIQFSTVSCGQVLDRLGAINQNLVPIGKAFVLTKSLNKPETYAIEII